MQKFLFKLDNFENKRLIRWQMQKFQYFRKILDEELTIQQFKDKYC